MAESKRTARSGKIIIFINPLTKKLMDENEIAPVNRPAADNFMQKNSRWLGWGGALFYLLVMIGLSLLSKADFSKIVSVVIILVVALAAYWVGALVAAILVKAPNRSASKALTLLGAVFGLIGVATIIAFLWGLVAVFFAMSAGLIKFGTFIIQLAYFIVALIIAKQLYTIGWWKSFFLQLLASVIAGLIILVAVLAVGFSVLGLIFGAVN